MSFPTSGIQKWAGMISGSKIFDTEELFHDNFVFLYQPQELGYPNLKRNFPIKPVDHATHEETKPRLGNGKMTLKT
jgi:hypothetical protein